MTNQSVVQISPVFWRSSGSGSTGSPSAPTTAGTLSTGQADARRHQARPRQFVHLSTPAYGGIPFRTAKVVGSPGCSPLLVGAPCQHTPTCGHVGSASAHERRTREEPAETRSEEMRIYWKQSTTVLALLAYRPPAGPPAHLPTPDQSRERTRTQHGTRTRHAPRRMQGGRTGGGRGQQ